MALPADFKLSVDKPKDDTRTTLRKFEGVLKTAQPDMSDRGFVTVMFSFTDVVVIESTEPYTFPIAQIPISYSDRGETVWAAFSASYRDLVPPELWGESDDPLEPLIGRKQVWEFAPAKLRRPEVDDEGVTKKNDKGKDIWSVQDGFAWQIVSVEGFRSREDQGKTLFEIIAEKVDGMTDQKILEWIYTDKEIKGYDGYAKLVESATDRELMPALLSAGLVTQDAEGVYKTVSK